MERFVIAGLSNPEGEYAGTRHNIGAEVVKALAKELGITLKSHKTPNSVGEGWTSPGGTPVTLSIGRGYMNNQGQPISQLLAYTGVSADRLIVVHDELDLPVGVLKTKRGGNGGHNGLKSVQKHTGSDEFIRLRFGIGRPPGRMDPAKYVLSKFPSKEKANVIDISISDSVDSLINLVTLPFDEAQQKLHSKIY